MDKNSTKDIANLAYSFTNGDYVMYKGKMDRIDAHMGGKVHLVNRRLLELPQVRPRQLEITRPDAPFLRQEKEF